MAVQELPGGSGFGQRLKSWRNYRRLSARNSSPKLYV